MRAALALASMLVACGAALTAGCGTRAPAHARPDLGPDPFVTCADGVRNFDESDVDCGGPRCRPCDDGLACARGGDCASTLCTNRRCAAATCFDGAKNGRETDLDCGGNDCLGCDVGGACSDGTDCDSAQCTNGRCVQSRIARRAGTFGVAEREPARTVAPRPALDSASAFFVSPGAPPPASEPASAAPAPTLSPTVATSAAQVPTAAAPSPAASSPPLSTLPGVEPAGPRPVDADALVCIGGTSENPAAYFCDASGSTPTSMRAPVSNVANLANWSSETGGADPRFLEISPPLAQPTLRTTPRGDFGIERTELRGGVHQGLDLIAHRDEHVLSATAGVVARAGNDPPPEEGGNGGGRFIVVRSGPYEVGYTNLGEQRVKEGALVERGQVIGTATEGYFHFQIKKHGVLINPKPYLRSGGPPGLPIDPPSTPAASADSSAPLVASGGAGDRAARIETVASVPGPAGNRVNPAIRVEEDVFEPAAPRKPRGEAYADGPLLDEEVDVWVLTEDSAVPLYARLPGGGDFGPNGNNEGFGPQCLYPDGTPAVARFWLPKVNLGELGYSPVTPGSYLFGAHPRAGTIDKERVERGAGGWAESARAKAYYKAPAWVYFRDYACTTTDGDRELLRVGADSAFGNYWVPLAQSPLGTSSVLPLVDFDRRGGGVDLPFRGATPYLGGWAHRYDGGCGVGSSAPGPTGSASPLRARHFALNFVASFDWTTYDPAIQAPIWVWLELGDPVGMKFRTRRARLYRADLQSMDDAGEPNELPGRAWLDLNFLEALRTGAHGMARYALRNADHSLNEGHLRRFIADSRARGWGFDTILDWGPRHQAMLADIDSLLAAPGSPAQPVPNVSRRSR